MELELVVSGRKPSKAVTKEVFTLSPDAVREKQRHRAYSKFAKQIEADEARFLSQFKTNKEAIDSALKIAQYQVFKTYVLTHVNKYDYPEGDFFNFLCFLEDRCGNLVQIICDCDEGYPTKMWESNNSIAYLINDILNHPEFIEQLLSY